MLIFLRVFLILLFILLLLWLAGFLFATDFSVPSRAVRQFRRVLVIFPHADDEAISCGGFLHQLTSRGSIVTVALLTKGEKGPNATHASSLKEVRTQEARTAANILGISRLVQEDFGDAALQQKKQELRIFIAALIEQEIPDLLVTYDLAGFYGHPDHIACSEVVSELQKTSFPEIALWYVTFPRRILAKVKMPEDIALDPHVQEKRAYATHKIFIGADILPKIKAWYTYKSQLVSLSKGIGIFSPRWFLWFLLSLVLFEYFAEVS
ncbi:MAG TPA: PIG-L family deacetylase [Ktedonobacteraceae bacterium]|nr:PIG-L family deacetylase [Ktedonobacteraceae bacterium]